MRMKPGRVRIELESGHWAASPDATCGSPVLGYCQAGGSHRTIRAVVAEVRKYHPREMVYRNGRVVSGGL